MILNNMTNTDIKTTLAAKLKRDFNVSVKESTSLAQLKKMNETANRNLERLNKEFLSESLKSSYALNQLVAQYTDVAIKEKEAQVTRSLHLSLAPKMVVESFISGVSLKSIFADLRDKLNMSEDDRRLVAEAVVDSVYEEYNEALDKKTNWDEVKRLRKGKEIELSPAGEVEDDDFAKTLERVREFHRKLKGKSAPKESALAETLYQRSQYLVETNVEEAEIMMSTKGFSRSLQEMIEKLGRMTNEDLPPVTDHIRVVYGLEAATNFQESTHEVLQSVMDTLYSAKFFIDEAVIRMSEHKVPGVVSDMDSEVSGNDFTDDLGFVDVDGEGSDEELLPDEFASVDLEEPLGRAKKESVQQLKAKLESITAKYNSLLESRSKKKF